MLRFLDSSPPSQSANTDRWLLFIEEAASRYLLLLSAALITLSPIPLKFFFLFPLFLALIYPGVKAGSVSGWGSSSSSQQWEIICTCGVTTTFSPCDFVVSQANVADWLLPFLCVACLLIFFPFFAYFHDGKHKTHKQQQQPAAFFFFFPPALILSLSFPSPLTWDRSLFFSSSTNNNSSFFFYFSPVVVTESGTRRTGCQNTPGSRVRNTHELSR